MPINISYQPAAAAVGGLGLIGGQGDYIRWLNQFRLQQWQVGTNASLQMQQMQNQRALALMQMANDNQKQQQDQAFQMQKLPYQAAIEAQQQAYQYGLQGQNQQNLAQLEGQIRSDQSTQDAAEQQQLLAAQQQGQLGNQMEMAKYEQQLKQQAPVEQLFANPLQQHMQNVSNANGYTFTPEQQQQVDKHKNNIQGIQNALSDGTVTKGDAFKSLQDEVGRLNNIKPAQPPPMSAAQMIAKNTTVGLLDPSDPEGKRIVPGTEKMVFSYDPKTGRTSLLNRGAEKQSQTVEYEGHTVPIEIATQMQGLKDKIEGSAAKRQAAIEKEYQSAIQTQQAKDFQAYQQNPQAPMLSADPTWQAQTRAGIEQRHHQAAQAAQQQAAPVEAEARAAAGAQGHPTMQNGAVPQPPAPGIPGQPQPAQAGAPQQQQAPVIRNPRGQDVQLPPPEEIQSPQQATAFLGWAEQNGYHTVNEIRTLPPAYIAMLARAKAIMEQAQPHRLNTGVVPIPQPAMNQPNGTGNPVHSWPGSPLWSRLPSQHPLQLPASMIGA